MINGIQINTSGIYWIRFFASCLVPFTTFYWRLIYNSITIPGSQIYGNPATVYDIAAESLIFQVTSPGKLLQALSGNPGTSISTSIEILRIA